MDALAFATAFVVGTRVEMGRAKLESVLVVDDDECFRTFVCGVLERDGLTPLGFERSHEALLASRRARPALALLDVNLPGISGYELCRSLKQERPELPVVFLSGERTESFDRVAGLLLGADDYLTKSVSEDELLIRVRRLIERSAEARPNGGLTPRELDVLQLLAAGRDQKEIAAELVISPNTVGTHIEHILTKLDVHSRAEAVAVAYRSDLVGAPG